MTRKIVTKIGTGIATMALLATSIGPAFAATDVNIYDNARNSRNFVGVSNNNSTRVSQNSNTHVLNGVYVNQNTGYNRANDNKGGGYISTGNANSSVNTNVTGGDNVAKLPDCGCDGNTRVNISGNGRNSHNTAWINNSNHTSIRQDSNTAVANLVGVSQNTGNNTANDNRHGGGAISTGDANSSINLNVRGGSNLLF